MTPQIEPVQDNTYSLQITNINFYGNKIDCSYSLTLYYLRKATSTNCIALGLTLPVLEPKIYDTRGEYGNQCDADAVIDTNEIGFIWHTM